MIEFLFVIIQVMIIDGILSIDNAAALAGIVVSLPKTKEHLHPRWLRKFGNDQRTVALKAGILGAFVGRGLMILLAGVIIANPWLRLPAALYLLYLVGTHFFNWKKWEPEFKGINTFWKTVVMVEIADLAFSIDNVVAVVAISQQIWIVILGVSLSIILMRFAAGIFVKLIEWYPQLEHCAFLLILAIAIELLLKFFGISISSILQFEISMAILGGFLVAKFLAMWEQRKQ